MSVELRTEVDVAAPAAVVWDYLTDWPRQSEWIPLTRVETVTEADRPDGRIRAWTGLGPVGFWDPMTITGWEPPRDGRGRCAIRHTGRVVRGDAEFTVTARGPERCTCTWAERLELPGGRVAERAWQVLGPVMERGVRLSLLRMAKRAEQLHAG